MSVALRYAARSDVGLVRSNNQDSAYAGPHLLMVADGMGGHAGGDVASSVAVAAFAPLDGESHGPDDALDQLEGALEAARDEIVARSEADPDLAGMGTTVIAILRAGNKLAMVHLGDSRGYLLRDGVLTQVTTDHTFVQHLVEIGRITPEEAEHHPQRSVVMRVLGDFDSEITPDLSVREARPGDRWLLCSDGLSGFVSASTIEETLGEVTDVDACADRLVQLALRAGGGDNVTVIVADVVELDELADGTGPSTQATIVGAAATTRHEPTTAADGPAARAAALTQTAKDAPGDDAEEDEDAQARGSRLPWILAAAAVLILVLGFGGYRWTQTQYYVGVDGDEVTIFRGIPQSIGPWELSTPVVHTGTSLDEVDSDYLRERVTATIRADSLVQARAVVANLDKDLPGSQPSPTPSGTASPAPTDTTTPTETAAPTDTTAPATAVPGP